jgi:CheY-like chemotaxis protein
MQRVTKKRILIVEDDAESGRLLLRILETEGYEVALATDADSAVAAAWEQPFDLAISDLLLRDGKDGGLDVVDSIRTIQPDLMVLFMSGYGAPRPGRGSPGDPILWKPFKASELLARVEQALNDRT